MQNGDIFCRAIAKVINKNKLPSHQQYFVSDGKFLHNIVREDDKLSYVLVVPKLLLNMCYITHMIPWLIMVLLRHIDILNACTTM